MANDVARQQLLNRILASREFAHAHTLKRILAYLCERAAEGGKPPKEYDIAVQAMGRPESFDPRTDPIVRVSVASVRDRLLAYFATEGQHEPLRLAVPKGKYLAVFTEAAPAAETKSIEHALRQFWKPYLAGEAPNVIAYTEPVFFRDDKGHYIRDWYVNDPGAAGRLTSRMKRAGYGTLEPSFHYLSTGEVHCMLSIARLFHETRVPIETRNCRISAWNELRAANLILLGSPRTNAFLDSLQSGGGFVITADRIENRARRPGEKPYYKGRRYLDGKLVRMTEYALVTRRAGLAPGRAVTLIAANHGRAIEGAGHFLTLEDRVESVLRAMGLADAAELPPCFQMLMRVETIDIDDEVAGVQCVAHRVLES